MKLGSSISNLKGSPTMGAAENVRKLLAQKKDVIRFDIGEPDFDTPLHISEAGIEAIKRGFTHYTSARGIPELQSALAHDLKTKGLEAGSDQLIFYPGSKFSLYSIFSLLLDDGDEVIIQDPLWPTYASIIEYLHGKAVRVKDWNEENPSEFSVASFVEKITPRTKAVMLNSPCNPTGATVSPEDTQKLLEECDKKGVPLILDRIYSSITYDGTKDTLPSYDLERGNLIVVSGFSKEFAMTGWRLGYTAASRSFTKLLADYQENTTSCPASFVQKAAVAALTAPRDWQRKMNKEYEERRAIMISGISKIQGWKCVPPPGAFYCFARINSNDSVSYAKDLLSEKLVSTVAGAYFGDGGESHLRLAFTTPKERIREGLERIHAFAKGKK
ncbi:MAG: pyridoxal phosphate-dependent aminotransferase [Nitrososphaerales archaeon]